MFDTPKHMTAADVLSTTGSRIVPLYVATESDGRLWDRELRGEITIREHAENAARHWSHVKWRFDWEYDDAGTVCAALEILECDE